MGEESFAHYIMSMDQVVISKKKPTFPVSPRLQMFLENYGRDMSFTMKYEDLWGWSEAIALEDKYGNNSFWETLIHPSSKREELDENLKMLYCQLKMAGDLEAARRDPWQQRRKHAQRQNHQRGKGRAP